MIYYNVRKNNNVFFFAHRGAPQLISENTIESVNKAISLGCDGIEVDLQKTKDNKIILFHDDYITTNHRKHYIYENTLNQINKLCKTINLPAPDTLKELACVIKRNPKIVFNLDIKSLKIINSNYLKLIRKTVTTKTLIKQCILSSFNYALLIQMKLTFNSKISMACILGSKRFGGRFKIYSNKLLLLILKPHFLHSNGRHTNKKLIDWAHQHSMCVNVYTINEVEIFKKIINLGADGIFTDNHRFYSKNT